MYTQEFKLPQGSGYMPIMEEAGQKEIKPPIRRDKVRNAYADFMRRFKKNK